MLNSLHEHLDAAIAKETSAPEPKPSARINDPGKEDQAPEPRKKTPESEPKPDPKKKDEPAPDDKPNPEDDPFALPEKKEEAPKEDAEEPKPEEPAKKEKIHQLRENYDRLKTEHERLKTEHETLKKAPRDDSALKQAQVERDALKSRLEKAEEELRYTAYEKSSEYQEKHLAPIQRAFDAAYADVSELTIANGDGTERKATSADFDALMNMPLNKAAEVAEELFGKAAAPILSHRQRIHAMNRERQSAMDEYRKSGVERQKQMSAKESERMESLRKEFKTTRESLAERAPEMYKPDESDPDGNKWLEKGAAFAEAVFNPPADLDDLQAIKIHAEAHNRLTAFPRIVHRNQVQAARINELEAIVKEYESSSPGKGESGKGAEGKKKPSIQSIYDMIDNA